MHNGRPWNMALSIVRKSDQLLRIPGCFAVMFTNTGDSVAYLNDIIVYPAAVPNALGDSRTLSGHEGDEYKGNLTVKIVPGGANPQLEVVQLFYTDCK